MWWGGGATEPRPPPAKVTVDAQSGKLGGISFSFPTLEHADGERLARLVKDEPWVRRAPRGAGEDWRAARVEGAAPPPRGGLCASEPRAPPEEPETEPEPPRTPTPPTPEPREPWGGAAPNR